MTARSISAPCMMHPSEMRALWMLQPSSFEAGRKRGWV